MFYSNVKRAISEDFWLYAIIVLGLGMIYSLPLLVAFSNNLFVGSANRPVKALVTNFAGEPPRQMYSYQGDSVEYVSAVNANVLGERAVNFSSESPTLLVHETDDPFSRLSLLFHPNGVVVRTVITPQRQFVHFAQYELVDGLILFSPLFKDERTHYVEKVITHWPIAVATVRHDDGIRLINPTGSGLTFKHQN